MDAINLADAKAHPSELIDRAEAGDPIEITRLGKPLHGSLPWQGRKPIDILGFDIEAAIG